ncbi:MAG: hypothetical protein K1X64_19455 [Myxococcaceae bacterium]|nr:hypothetical protein [Myxococcaceae bacterium]
MHTARNALWKWALVVSVGLLSLLGCPGGGSSDGGTVDSGVEVDAGETDAGCRALFDICTAEHACCPGRNLSCESSLCCLTLEAACQHDGECCSKSCVGGKCTVRTNCADAGVFCSTDDQCCTGLSCYQSECKACQGFGKACGQGQTCCGALACQVDGTCG